MFELSTFKPVSKDSEKPCPTETRRWAPWLLRRPVLLTFAAVFLSLAIVLAAVNAYSRRNNMICGANSASQLLWTYTPTAMFTLVSILCSSTEYRSKQNAALDDYKSRTAASRA